MANTILLMQDGIYRLVIGNSLIPINSSTRGTAHKDNTNKIPSLIVTKVYMLKSSDFDVIPYSLPKWKDNIKLILSKYFEEISNEI